MRIPERIEYLNKYKKLGDIKAVATHLQLNLSTVSDIIKGKFYGKHGEKVLEKLEEIIEQRAEKEKTLTKKYKKKINGSL